MMRISISLDKINAHTHINVNSLVGWLILTGVVLWIKCCVVLSRCYVQWLLLVLCFSTRALVRREYILSEIVLYWEVRISLLFLLTVIAVGWRFSFLTVSLNVKDIMANIDTDCMRRYAQGKSKLYK